MTLHLFDRLPVGMYTGSTVAAVLLADPGWILSRIDYGYKGFGADVWDAIELLGVL